MFHFSRFRLFSSKILYTPRRRASWILGGKQTAEIPIKEHYWKTSLKFFLKLLGVLGVPCLFFIRSIDIPFCDRKRFTIVPELWEDYIGSIYSGIYLSKYKNFIVDPRHPLALQVEAIGNSICEQCNLPKHKFILVNSSEVNAFSIPGRSIFVHTGILPLFANQSGCAMILSHELSHSLAAHGIQSLYLILPILLIASMFGDIGLLMSNYIVELPRSRKNEIEADKMGLRLMANSCFDIEESIAVFNRMADATGDDPSNDWVGTHSSWKSRINNLNKLKSSQEVLSLYKRCSQVNNKKTKSNNNFFANYNYPKQYPRIKDEQYQQLLSSSK